MFPGGKNNFAVSFLLDVLQHQKSKQNMKNRTLILSSVQYDCVL